MKNNKYAMTFGRCIREAREDENMTINDLAFAMAKNKEDEVEIRQIEKKLRSWEEERAYPSLDEIYELGNYIKINPGELLTFRNRGRKEFLRDSAEYQATRHSWFTVSSKMSHGFDKLAGVLIFASVCLFIFITFKFADRLNGKKGIEQKIIVDQIEESVSTQNTITNEIVNNTAYNLIDNTVNNTTINNIVNNTINNDNAIRR